MGKPKIRFKGYEDDWEQRRLGNVLLSLQNNTLSRANLSDESGIAKNVHYGDVLIKFGEVLDVRKEKLPMITDENVLSKYKASFLQNGDVIVADTAEDSTVGKCSEIAGLNDEVVLSGLHTIPYRPIEKFASGYLGYYLNSGAYHNQLIPLMQGIKVTSISKSAMQNTDIDYPKSQEEQGKIGAYFKSLDEMITLHQRKCYRFIDIALDAWEQRKLDGWGTFYYGRSCPKWSVTEDATIPCIRYGELYTKFGAKIDRVYSYTNMPPENLRFSKGTEVLIPRVGEDPMDYNHCTWLSMPDVAIGEMISVFNTDNNPLFTATMFNATLQNEFAMRVEGGSVTNLYFEKLKNIEVSFPSIQEQEKIAAYFENLDHLITLHQYKLFCAKNVMKYITTDINTPKKEAIMAELESVIEQKLIEQLIYGDSQWTYREDLKTEADLWKNFRYILEQNNKERLNGEPLSDVEFEQVKNQLQFSSFYKAGEWLVGENGKVMVHVQRDTERLHLVVMNHEHIAGGSSVYEVINQYNALKMDEDSSVNARDRRFDVTLMINGLPMIHIELKNKQHSYMDGFRQIKKYIGEGKFTGIFSAVQMFVISNGVDTKYFSAASDTELNPKFISGWLDKENNAVSDYLDFAKSVLRIPEAHEMIARYTVLDEEAKSLIL